MSSPGGRFKLQFSLGMCILMTVLLGATLGVGISAYQYHQEANAERKLRLEAEKEAKSSNHWLLSEFRRTSDLKEENRKLKKENEMQAQILESYKPKPEKF